MDGGNTPLTHLDADGRARMVDVGSKPVSERRAVAVARLRMTRPALEALAAGRLPKGDAMAVARVAGIQAAKRTADLIPLCHPLPLDAVRVDFEIDDGVGCVDVRVEVRARARTGVEMEALVAASTAALALYDMVKAVDRTMVVDELRVEEKEGGRRGTFRHPRARAPNDARPAEDPTP